MGDRKTNKSCYNTLWHQWTSLCN